MIDISGEEEASKLVEMIAYAAIETGTGIDEVTVNIEVGETSIEKQPEDEKVTQKENESAFLAQDQAVVVNQVQVIDTAKVVTLVERVAKDKVSVENDIEQADGAAQVSDAKP